MKGKILKGYLVFIKILSPGKDSLHRFFCAENDEQALEEALRIVEEVKKAQPPDYPEGKAEIDRLYQVREIDFTSLI